jgi:hypothetical protein
MTDTVTVLACPEHDFCVVRFTTVALSELGDRKALSLPYEYEPWLQSSGRLPVSVDHIPAPPGPDALLVGEVVIAPHDIASRLHRVERDTDDHIEALAGLRAFQVETMSEAQDTTDRLRELGIRLTQIHDLLAEQQASDSAWLSVRLDSLEAFAVSTKRRRRAWERFTAAQGVSPDG